MQNFDLDVDMMADMEFDDDALLKVVPTSLPRCLAALLFFLTPTLY
jgi:hypothetical protein